MSRPDSWRRDAASYPVTETFQTRFQDLDLNGHLNNVAFASLFESARVMLNRSVGGWADRPANERTMVAEVTITYLAEGHFPGDVIIASGIGRIGTSSWTILQAMFQDGACIATCDTVVVVRTDNRAAPMRDTLRADLTAVRVSGPQKVDA